MSTTTPKFRLGQVVATPGAIAAMTKSGDTPASLIDRHVRLDQGELDDDDHRLNAEAIEEGTRVFSSFKLKDDIKVWVITEADRGSTCILLPEEY